MQKITLTLQELSLLYWTEQSIVKDNIILEYEKSLADWWEHKGGKETCSPENKLIF